MGVADGHADIGSGIGFQIGGHLGGKEEFPHGQGGAEGELAHRLPGQFHALCQNPVVVLHGQGRAVELLAGRGQGELAVLVLEQLGAVLVLQVVDVLTHRRLGDV